MRARLERDVERRPGGMPATTAAVLERGDLGVPAAELRVKALADRLTSRHQDRPDQGIGADPPPPPLGKLERPPEMGPILICGDRGQVRLLVVPRLTGQSANCTPAPRFAANTEEGELVRSDPLPAGTIAA